MVARVRQDLQPAVTFLGFCGPAESGGGRRLERVAVAEAKQRALEITRRTWLERWRRARRNHEKP
jgi:hypothetical protein